MIHRQRYMKQMPGKPKQTWGYATACGIVVDRNRTTVDTSVSCLECLRDVVMIKEQELELLKNKLSKGAEHE